MSIHMSEEQFSTLLSRLMEMGKTSTNDTTPPVTPPPAQNGSFIGCDARYDGTRDHALVEEFINKATIFKKVSQVSDQNALDGLPLLLQGEASTWWTGIRNKANTWEEATNLIQAAFAPKEPAHRIYLQIFGSYQTADTPTDQFVCEKRALFARLPEQHNENTQLHMIYGLLKREIREQLPRDRITSYDYLLQESRLIEANLREAAQAHSGAPANRTSAPKKIRCDFCRYPGHTINDCRKKQKAQENTKRPETNRLQCYGCNRPGVTRAKCPDCAKTAVSAPPTRDASFFFCETTTKSRVRPAVQITISNINGTAYLDSGSHLSLASHRLVDLLRDQGIHPKPTTAWITLADGHRKLKRIQTIDAPVTLHGKTTPVTFYVFPDAAPNATTILGIDFLTDAELVINFKIGRWHFHGTRHQTYGFTLKDQESTLVNSPTITDEQLHTLFLEYAPNPCITPIPSPVQSVQIADPDSPDNYGPDPLAMDTEELRFKPTTAWTKPPLIDHSPPEEQRLEYMWDDSLQYIESHWDIPSYHICTITAEAVHLRADEGNELQPEEQERLNYLLAQHKHLYEDQGPPTGYAEHRIDTGNHSPISSPPYRLGPTKRTILFDEVQRLLDLGIVETCESAWTAPVILVPKKTGGIRMCVDYRKLNAITTPDVYPLPRIDDLLHSTGNNAIMSTLDLMAGYYQIRIRPEDKDKTAFITPFGTYRFNRLPFGLRNAPSTFQRLMDRFRSGIPSGHLLVYLDDLIVMSTSLHEHIQTLETIFARISTFNLRLNRPKCHFCRPQVKYLGHIISTTGIHTDPDKIAAISQREPPTNVKQLQSFLQTCSWYRRFITHFAELSRPLTQLTRQTATWEWNAEQQRAYQQLQEALTTAPILRQADSSLPYTLRTDASAYALGAALLQGEGPNEHPIEYASRLLTPAERNYTTTEREALAVVWAVTKFRGYLEESSSIIVTDHQPLKWLLTLKTPTGRLARWSLQLQPYNLQIEYTPGKANVVADTLSRPNQPIDTINEHSACTITIDLPANNPGQLRIEQLRDPELCKILDCFNSNDPEKITRWTSRGYLTSQGVLYRYSPDHEEDNAQLVIPSHKKTEILQAYHDAPTAGHYGAERTIIKIQRSYFWPGMRRDIQNYVKNCTACQRYKASNQKPPGLIQTPVMQQRFEVLAIDLFGPLPPGPQDEKWILIVEDTTSRWIELFPLKQATADACGWTLLYEFCFRYGLPRRIISDNGTQFTSQVIQYICHCLQIDQSFTPVYHPAANPVERRNRDLKTQLSIQLGTRHSEWPTKLPSIRFAINSAQVQATGHTPAYLTFGRELRTPFDVTHDVRHVIQNDTPSLELSQQLTLLTDAFLDAREINEKEQDRRKLYADKRRSAAPSYRPGDLVWVKSHPISQASKGYTGKFAPKRDGPYVILTQRGPNSYEIATQEQPTQPIGLYHTSSLTLANLTDTEQPITPIRRRGRPKKQATPEEQKSEPSSRRLRPRKGECNTTPNQ